MQKRYRWLTLHQFDQTLSQLKPLLNLPVPNTGWIRAIRESLGMTAKQLAKRLGVSPPRITQLEADETDGRVTIKTLRRSAEALDCVLVYGLVPRTSLEEMVKQQARKVAQAQVQYVSHSMQLEAQKLPEALLQQEVEAVTEAVLKAWPRHLWDDGDDKNADESKKNDATRRHNAIDRG